MIRKGRSDAQLLLWVINPSRLVSEPVHCPKSSPDTCANGHFWQVECMGGSVVSFTRERERTFGLRVGSTAALRVGTTRAGRVTTCRYIGYLVFSLS